MTTPKHTPAPWEVQEFAELLDALIKITNVVDAELHDVLPTREHKVEVVQQALTAIEKALK